MGKKPRSAEDVCVEYAIAAAEVRRAQVEISKHPCNLVDDWRDGIMVDDCLDKHFRVETVEEGPGRIVERPELAAEDMCESCQKRLQFLDERRDARRRLGAAKRSVEVVGRRLNVGATVAIQA